MHKRKKGEDNTKSFDFITYHRKCIKEQEEVERYVLTKHLEKPKTNVMTVILWILLYICSSTAGTLMATLFLQIEGLFLAIVIAFVWIAFLFLFVKIILIKLIECYQHYAKEETRRRCLCMPTCSEFAILALKKYCVFKALYKIYKRLFKTCKGGIYKKDFP